MDSITKAYPPRNKQSSKKLAHQLVGYIPALAIVLHRPCGRDAAKHIKVLRADLAHGGALHFWHLLAVANAKFDPSIACFLEFGLATRHDSKLTDEEDEDDGANLETE